MDMPDLRMRQPALPRGSFRRRLTGVMLGLVLLVAALIGAAHAWQLNARITESTQDKALTLARSVASQPEVRAEIARLSAGPSPARQSLEHAQLQQSAEDVRRRTGALFVVLTDETGIRLSHPDPSKLGAKVSTDPSGPLAGREETTGNIGTLGPSAGAKVPVYGPDGTVVGEVSVGFASASLAEQWLDDALPGLAAVLAVALLGAATASAMSTRLHRGIMGLEPEEISALVTEQEAVLHGVDEGVIGIDAHSVLRLANTSAQEMLPGLVLDAPVESAGLPAELLELLTGAGGTRTVVAGERILVCTASPVRREGTELGYAVVLRDRTHVQSLSRELADAQALAGALRIQRHEFANQLHMLGGMLAAGAVEEARGYIGTLTRAGGLASGLAGLERIGDEGLAQFLSAKAAQAHEKSIDLRLSFTSEVWGRLALPAGLQDATAVLGNLLDNAMTAALAGADPRPAVLVDLVEMDGDLHIAVTDTGPGIEDPELVFRQGWSGFESIRGAEGGHGIGLPLVRRIARARGGDVWIGSARGRETPWLGATVCAHLPGVIAAAPRSPSRSHPGSHTDTPSEETPC